MNLMILIATHLPTLEQLHNSQRDQATKTVLELSRLLCWVLIQELIAPLRPRRQLR